MKGQNISAIGVFNGGRYGMVHEETLAGEGAVSSKQEVCPILEEANAQQLNYWKLLRAGETESKILNVNL